MGWPRAGKTVTVSSGRAWSNLKKYWSWEDKVIGFIYIRLMFVSTALFVFIFSRIVFCQVEQETITLPVSAEVGCIVSDGTFLYVGMNWAGSNIYRIRISDMTINASITEGISDRFIWGMGDFEDNYVYFGSGNRDYTVDDLGEIVKIDTTTLSSTAFESLIPQIGPGNNFYPTSMTLDEKSGRLFVSAEKELAGLASNTVGVYGVTGTGIFVAGYLSCISPLRYWTESIILGERLIVFGQLGSGSETDYAVLNITSPTCQLLASGTLSGYRDITSVTVDSSEQYLYLTFGGVIRQIVKIDSSNFGVIEYFTLLGTDGIPHFSIVTEDSWVWTATERASQSAIIRLKIDDFTNVYRGYLSVENVIVGAYSDDVFPTLFLGTSSTPGTITKLYVGVCKPGTKDPLPCTTCQAGTYTDIESSPICIPCDAGFYSTVVGANTSSTCLPCPSGYVSDVVGSNSIGNCTICPPGTYANITTCVDCPIGTFQNSSGEVNGSSCQDCPMGSYADQVASTSCTYCLPGTYSTTPAGNTSQVCLPCPIGTYSGVVGANSSSSCFSCPQGYILNDTAATSLSDCELCPVGTFANLTQCKSCDMGTYNNLTGRWIESQCLPCPPGQFQPNPSQSSCYLCGAGKYSEEIGAISNTICQNCPIGTYSEKLGASSLSDCIHCPRGTVSAVIGAWSNASCVPCVAGEYADTSVCRDCPVGTFGNFSGAYNYTDCYDCGAGKFNDVPGSQVCKVCPDGTYSAALQATDISTCVGCGMGNYSNGGAGATSSLVCQPCPAGTWSNLFQSNDVSLCSLCPSGTYSTVVASQAFSDCQNCPAGTYNMIAGASNDTMCIPCLPGFFSAISGATSNLTCVICPEGTFSATEGSTTCQPCASTSYCPPGSSFEMPSTPSKNPSVGIIDPTYDAKKAAMNLWWIKIVVLVCLVVFLCIISTLCLAISCCYFKNINDLCAYMDCLFARLHYTPNKQPVTRHQTLLGGLCTLFACQFILIFFVAVFSSFFSSNVVTRTYYESTGLEKTELVGDPKYTKGKYSIHMLIYGVFDTSSCSPSVIPSSTVVGYHTVSSQILPIPGGTGCQIDWVCEDCQLGGVKNTLTFAFRTGSFATGVEFEVGFPSILSEEEYSVSGNMNADPSSVMSGTTNPSIIHYLLYKTEHRKKTILSGILDLFKTEFGVQKEVGLTGNWEDLTLGDQIITGTGTMISSGLRLVVEYKIAPEKYIIEDEVQTDVVTFLLKLAASILFVLFVMGCFMRCCECVWYRIFFGHGEDKGRTDPSSAYMSINDPHQTRIPNSHMMMRTAHGDGLSSYGDEFDENAPPRELVDSIVDVDWKEGMNSVELAEVNDDFMYTPSGGNDDDDDVQMIASSKDDEYDYETTE